MALDHFPHAGVPPASVSECLVDLLVDLGVRQAYGVFGGGIAPFCRTLAATSIAYLHMRHETGAAFAALEASLASRRPTVVFTTTGPGLTNALTGLLAARLEGGHVIVVSGSTAASRRGRMAIQETALDARSGLSTSGEIFHYAATIEHPAQLEAVAARLAFGVARPEGFVAHVSVPLPVQTLRASTLAHVERSATVAACAPEVARRAAELLAGDPFVVWVGFGARHAAPSIRALVDRTGCHVLCTPRARGIFPEDDPRFLGATGIARGEELGERLARVAPARALVLGTRLGESSSRWAVDLVPPRGLLQVDTDPSAFGRGYPSAPTIGIVSDVGSFVGALLLRWPDIPPRGRPHIEVPLAPSKRWDDEGSRLVRPQALMHAVQKVIVDESDAILLAESGNSFSWANRLLRFRQPGRYRVSTHFGAMGHATTGVVGAALGSGRTAVALVGDGAMLMQNEISSAVQYRARAVWIVLNDARYGMCEQGMERLGWQTFGTAIPAADFVALARAVGADGISVENETALVPTLSLALEAGGPFVVDVRVDPSQVTPMKDRLDSIFEQVEASSADAADAADAYGEVGG